MINLVDARGRHSRSNSRTTRPIPCRVHDLDLWFADSPEDLAKAKQLCGDCPLRAPCLQGALARSEPWGVWGGELMSDGYVVAYKRRPGRPRKHAA